MAKIPFSIEHREKIESGEYKVINRIGEEVRIICWDWPDEDYPIVAFDGDRMPSTWGKDGRFMSWKESDSDLFLVTPEPELTEFEKLFSELIADVHGAIVPLNMDEVKESCQKLMELAKKELCKDCASNPALWPPCHYGGKCTNNFRDCINCLRKSTIDINTTTGTSTAKVEG